MMVNSGKRKIWLCALAMAAAVSFAACGNGGAGQQPTSSQEQTTKKEVPLSDIHEAVKAVYGENYIPSMAQDAETIAALYGVSEDMYEEAIAEVAMISVHVDTFLAFKAKEGQADAIEQKLTEYREYLVSNAVQYPMNIPKIEASQVVREGDYVFFVQLGTVEDDMLDEDELLKEFQESNQLAVDAIKEQFQ